MNYVASTMKEGIYYYGVIKFYSQVLSDCYILRQQFITRSAALSFAKKEIKRIQQYENK